MTNEELVKGLTEALNKNYYNFRQDRRGSDLTPSALKEALGEIERHNNSQSRTKQLEIINNVKKIRKVIDDIVAETGNKKTSKANLNKYANKKAQKEVEFLEKTYIEAGYSIKNAQKKAKKQFKILREQFFNEAQGSVKSLKNLTKDIGDTAELVNKLKEKEIREAKLNQKIGINGALTNGYSNSAISKFDKYSSVANSLQGVFGEKSFIGKIAVNYAKLANTSTEYGINGTAAVGYTQMIIDAILKGFEMATRFLQISAQENQANFSYVSKNISLDSEMAMKELSREIELSTKQAQAQSAYQIKMAQAELSRYSGSLNAQILGFTDITGSVYKALDNAITYEYAKKSAEIEKKYAIGEGNNSSLSILREKLDVGLEEKRNVTESQKKLSKTQLDREQQKVKNERYSTGLNAGGAIFGGIVGSFLGPYGTAIGTGIGTQAGRLMDFKKANDEYYYGLRENADNLRVQTRQIHESFVNQTKTATSSIKEIALDAQKQIELGGIKTQEEIEKALAKFAEDIDKKFEVSENFANEMSKSLGYFGKQMDYFEDSMFNTQVAVSAFGKKMEDMAKLQNGYTEATGRNIQFTNEDYTKSFAMGTFWGDDTINQLNSGMEVFNHSVSDSNEMFFEMQKSLWKMGLNGRKYGKDLIKDMRLANKYNFNGGVKGLMEMSKWAQNVRFNTSSLDGMLDKVNEGGLEGVVKQAAELQVLGGNFAMGSDPLAMGWEALNDAGAYAKRINGMLSGLGVFNSTTGEVDVLGPNRIIAGQAAKSLGMSVEDVIAQIKQEGKISKIRSEVGNKFDNEQLSLLTNKAQYVDGQWKVNLGNGVMTNISDVTSDDLKVLVDDTGKSLEQLAIDSLSVQRKQEAAQSLMQATMQYQYDFFTKEHAERIKNMLDQFWYNKEDWKKTMNDYVSAATNEASMLNNFFGNNGAEALGNQLMAGANATLNCIDEKLQGIAEAIGAKYNVTGKELESVGGNQNLLKIKKLMNSYSGKNDREKYEKAYKDLSVDGTKWYTDPEIISAMNTLRADPTDLLKIKDRALQQRLFAMIYRWDDEGTTTDFDYHNDKDLIGIGKKLGLWRNDKFGDYGGHRNHTDEYDEIKVGALGSAKLAEKKWANINTTNDGLIAQNGSLTKINSGDQVLAAKKDGPIDRMLDMVQSHPIEVKPISININGNIQLNGTNVDFTSQMQNDPNFKEALWKIISVEVSKRADNSGRTYDPLYNRIQTI